MDKKHTALNAAPKHSKDDLKRRPASANVKAKAAAGGVRAQTSSARNGLGAKSDATAKRTVKRTSARSPHVPFALFITAAIVVCLVAAGFILYPVTRDYYVTLRENEQLQAEYDAVLDRNERIQERIDSLQTPEGIEDRAREEFGWVREGEKAVNITGLDISSSSTVLPATVLPGSVKPPSNWLTDTLDSFFGVEQHTIDPLDFELLEP